MFNSVIYRAMHFMTATALLMQAHVATQPAPPVAPLYRVRAPASAYAPAAGGINCDGDCSRTASGQRPGPTVAACGYGLKLGARFRIVELPERGVLECGDRFGVPVPAHAIDLFFHQRADAMQFGRRWLTLEILRE